MTGQQQGWRQRSVLDGLHDGSAARLAAKKRTGWTTWGCTLPHPGPPLREKLPLRTGFNARSSRLFPSSSRTATRVRPFEGGSAHLKAGPPVSRKGPNEDGSAAIPNTALKTHGSAVNKTRSAGAPAERANRHGFLTGNFGCCPERTRMTSSAAMRAMR